MENTRLTFDQLPSLIYQLSQEIHHMKDMMYELNVNDNSQCDKYFTVDQLSKYIPGNPAVTTIYGMVQRREIPYRKVGRRLIFVKVEIDNFIMERPIETSSELNKRADSYIIQKNKRGKRLK